jgi:hypothetical protein
MENQLFDQLVLDLVLFSFEILAFCVNQLKLLSMAVVLFGLNLVWEVNTFLMYQLDCSPACKPDQSYQDQLETAMSPTALPNFIIK